MNPLDVRVCFVGDSLTTGVGDRQWTAWPQRACVAQSRNGLAMTPYNLGVRGDTSVEIAQRWWTECSRRLVQPFAGGIVFAFGLNDTCVRDGVRRVHIEDSVANAHKTIAAACAFKPTLWIGPTPIDPRRDPCRVITGGFEHVFCNARVEALAERFRRAASELHTPFVDLFTELRTSEEWAAALAAGDGVHPSDAGHHLIAHTVVTSGPWCEWLRRIDAVVAA